MKIEDVFAEIIDFLAKMKGSNYTELEREIGISGPFLEIIRSDLRRRHK
jgi:hypothetical protein